MTFNNLRINNFRSKELLEIKLGSKLTLLVGENGSGKTSILDAIALCLGAILTHLPKVSGISFKKNDLRQVNNHFAPYTRVGIETTAGIVWDRTERRDKSLKTASEIPAGVGLQKLRKYLDEQIINPFNEGKDFKLPVFSYYGVSRALLEVPLRRRDFPKSHQRFEALENSLNSVTRFKSAFVWFYNKENEEQRKQRELKDFDYKLPELETVRSAITTMFPNITEPHIMLNPLRFAVKIDGELMDITQLSDGYKTLLSLVIDLASRMALANPDMTNPLETQAIVLIDEIDLHLHPEWQRRVVSDLMQVFSNTQFILTTHSPYIVEAVNNNLQRFQIANMPINDPEIEQLIAIAPQDVMAYYITDTNVISILDTEMQLLDDKLIHPFNKLSELYDRMRDVQWENQQHD
ncbi:MAG: AAA family ATPase [Paludibacter sp.]|nr:AAA family ATPase [Paludibacter sp.]